MAEMRRQASPATSVPPSSLVISTPAAPAPISFVPISSAPAVPSWKIYIEFQKVSDDLKVNVGSYMLTGDALTWWETCLKLHQEELELSTWDGFKRVFMQEYILDSKSEFADLKQWSRTVEWYKKEFDHYLPFVDSQVGDEQSKADRFLWGLNPDNYLAVKQFKPATYREATDRAIDQEKAMARVKTQDPQKVGSFFKKRKFDESRRPSISAPPKSDTGEASKELRVAKTVGQASVAQRTQPAPPICHTYGKVGHTCDQCRIFTRACFRCGKQGHRVANCPQPDPRAQSTQTVSQQDIHISDPNHNINPEPIQLYEDLTYDEHPICISDLKERTFYTSSKIEV
ncbi:hypothetical protein SLEP1_g27661 [Rubroshorea leprosula]|uniref:CCHC-type domain-containing protein n=1 Tax=Rubroshorea leprosula TaxID=152421 RepID=A0AAV5K0U1_9ROSI|nr:hypothetical protein SLEP1_g27661 [Rubroshorea leprosula]